MWLRLLLSDVSERADNGNAVGQLLLVLVVVLFEKSVADFSPHLLSDSDRCLVLVENHVWPFRRDKSKLSNAVITLWGFSSIVRSVVIIVYYTCYLLQ